MHKKNTDVLQTSFSSIYYTLNISVLSNSHSLFPKVFILGILIMIISHDITNKPQAQIRLSNVNPEWSIFLR